MSKKKSYKISEERDNGAAQDFGILLSGLVSDLMDEFDHRPAEELKAFMEGLAFGLQFSSAMNETPDDEKPDTNHEDIVLLFGHYEEVLRFKWNVERELVKTHRMTVKQLMELAGYSIFPPKSTCMGWTRIDELNLEIIKEKDEPEWHGECSVWVQHPIYIGYSDQYMPKSNKRRK